MRAFTVIDVPQRSEEWFAARRGRLTGSATKDAYAKTKAGWSESRNTLVMRLALERLTNRTLERDFTTQAMQDGIDREPVALAEYEALTGDLVERTGFLSHNTLMVGASLDGHLGDFDTLVSVKCRQPKAHWEFYEKREIPADALLQMRHELWLTGARQHVYVEFNPDFPAAARLVTKALTREAAKLDDYDQMVTAFLAELETRYQSMRTLTGLRDRLAEAVQA